jgi:ATP synthase protein I
MSGTQGGGSSGKKSFDERLDTARRRQGLDAPPPPPGGGPQGNALGVGLRVGVEMVSALAVAVLIGWWLDRWLHTKPFMLALFVLLGGAAGVANVWRLIAPQRPPARDGQD